MGFFLVSHKLNLWLTFIIFMALQLVCLVFFCFALHQRFQFMTNVSTPTSILALVGMLESDNRIVGPSVVSSEKGLA